MTVLQFEMATMIRLGKTLVRRCIHLSIAPLRPFILFPRYTFPTVKFLLLSLQRPSKTKPVESEIGMVVSWYTSRDPKKWFSPPTSFDDEVRTKFSHLVSQARNGELGRWAETPQGSLALIVLLDQFPRNIFPKSVDALLSDSKALQIASSAIANRFDAQLGESNMLHQMLFYMPFLHAEDLVAQVACKALFGNLLRLCPDDSECKKFIEMGAGTADSNLDCIKTFGRFPGRNAALGRQTSGDEVQWLERHPECF